MSFQLRFYKNTINLYIYYTVYVQYRVRNIKHFIFKSITIKNNSSSVRYLKIYLLQIISSTFYRLGGTVTVIRAYNFVEIILFCYCN